MRWSVISPLAGYADDDVAGRLLDPEGRLGGVDVFEGKGLCEYRPDLALVDQCDELVEVLDSAQRGTQELEVFEIQSRKSSATTGPPTAPTVT